MRLLRCELVKLNRPLLWSLGVVLATACVLPAWIGTYAASESRDPGMRLAAARHLTALSAGTVPAGLMASLPGLLVIAVLAGSHVGGEWTGRTIKVLLSQHGRRRDVLAAKIMSVWLGAVVVMTFGWVALAVAGPVMASRYHLPDSHLSAAEAAKYGGSQYARALLVLAVYAVIATAIATLTRNAVGTITATAGAMVLAGLLPAALQITRYAPTNWVQGWMGFSRAPGTIPTHWWSHYTYPDGSTPGHAGAFFGLLAAVVAGALLGHLRFSRMDITE